MFYRLLLIKNVATNQREHVNTKWNKAKIALYKENNFCNKYIHTMKITNYLQQNLPHSYMPHIELGTAVKKLWLRFATFHYFNQINKVYPYIASSNHILVITMDETSNVSTAAMYPRVGHRQYIVFHSRKFWGNVRGRV